MMRRRCLSGICSNLSTCTIVNRMRQLPLDVIQIYITRSGSSRCREDKFLNAFRACLYKRLKEQDVQPGNKVSIIGTGAVGMVCAVALLLKGITNDIALFDINKKLCTAEFSDLIHGSLFLNNCNIANCGEIESTRDSRVVVVTSGVRVKANQNRLEVTQKTANIIKHVMPDLVKQSPKAVFIIVSNPSDVMAWLAHKITKLPYERCISTGCHLDTARFRLFIAQVLGVATSSVNGFVLGENGKSSVPMWSSVTVGGVHLEKLVPNIGTDKDIMQWSQVHMDVVEAASKVIALKGYTSWAIGHAVADVVSAIFENSNRILSLSTNAKGMCGIRDDIFLSLPCIVNKWGLFGIIRPHLSEWESAAMKKSAKEVLKAQCDIKL